SGAQALAALAHGTDTIQSVDKIFGPGGLFVTLAKQQLFGQVGIDSIYGPTETLVIADESADPALVASDLLAQAEHDVLATPVLFITSDIAARRILAAIDEQLPLLERAEIARMAMRRGGGIIVKDIDRAIELANRFAPEHLCLLIDNPDSILEKIKNAGGVFVGESSPEVLGDYTAGPSHVMPTGGSARWASPLSILDFLRVMSLVELETDDLLRLGPDAAALARIEGLTGHARSIERRLESR
ncbi:MAG: histidinol dehydrogenase, partial [Dehalococcoidia bacterium]|nr:histidinol dehydrogenase [Dehalococcoidia bacterium]